MPVYQLSRLISIISLILVLTACSDRIPQTPEERVKAVIEAIEIAIEERDSSDIFEHVSRNYNDYQGRDKDGLRKLAQVYLFANQNIELIVNVTSIEPATSDALAVEATVTMIGSSANATSRISGLKMDNQQVSGAFTLEGDNWKLSSLSWDRESIF